VNWSSLFSFIPENEIGSELLREMRQKGQPLAVVIDEHGTVAGIATVEDLVEEIVGESGNDGKPPSPDVVREVGWRPSDARQHAYWRRRGIARREIRRQDG